MFNAAASGAAPSSAAQSAPPPPPPPQQQQQQQLGQYIASRKTADNLHGAPPVVAAVSANSSNPAAAIVHHAATGPAPPAPAGGAPHFVSQHLVSVSQQAPSGQVVPPPPPPPSTASAVNGAGAHVRRQVQRTQAAQQAPAFSSQQPVHGQAEADPTDERFVESLATVYEHLVKLSHPQAGQITRFHAVKPPEITIKDYLDRIKRYFGCSNECFVLSLVYIDRVVKLHDEFAVSILNVHRLLITSVMLAAKFFDDVYYSNAFYGRVGGVRTREINILEAHFLSLLDFHLFVSPQEYDQYRLNVLTAVYRQHNGVSLPRTVRKSKALTETEMMQTTSSGDGHQPLSNGQQIELAVPPTGGTNQNVLRRGRDGANDLKAGSGGG